MPLPEGGGAWPPEHLAPITDRLCAWSAWYSGNPDELEKVYGGAYGSGFDTTSRQRVYDRPSQHRGGVVGRFARWFWGQPLSSNQQRAKLHVPAASDLAQAGADLLFTEPPTFTVKNKGTQARLEELADDGLHAKLLESAELSCALGGVYLRICWDSEMSDRPWLSVQHADAAVPEWSWEQLRAVTFWRVIHDDGKKTVRHLERHEPGFILNGLYEGTPDGLGKRIDLGAYPETAGLDPVIETGLKTSRGKPMLTAVYIPNARPNRTWRNLPAAAPLGRADFGGVEPMLDALDETYTSWMRDIRIGKGRLIVPDTYLQSLGAGDGARFDAEREVWQGLSMLASKDVNQLTVAQFAIRVQEHRDTATDLMEQILRAAGYSAQTFGLAGEVAVTATEVAAKERRSLITRGKKILNYRPRLADALELLLAVDQRILQTPGVTAERPRVEFADAVSEDMGSLAQTAQLLRAAEAASTETLVAMVHPDWDETQVKAEARAIKDEAPAELSGPGPDDGMGSSGPGASSGEDEPGGAEG
ncbi:phage portal protein [Actinomadura sp. KC216]|uniref:phage portal protein n=1 Tax=Actinomadura sp. KC216 TaxID=2530370 RepID=UPI001404F535|nr:phage portal protein [Actinomadura sp. KC216]